MAAGLISPSRLFCFSALKINHKSLNVVILIVLIFLPSIHCTTTWSLFVNMVKLFMLPFTLLGPSPSARNNFQNILLGQWKCYVFPHRIWANQRMEFINFVVKNISKFSLKAEHYEYLLLNWFLRSQNIDN